MAPPETEEHYPQGLSSRAASRSQQDRMESAAPIQRRSHNRKQFVLCFDGTGNKFSGTDADSNILKIYRMLDRNGDDQFHYYQPGIGTYVAQTGGSMSQKGRIDRFKHWYAKAKDSAVGRFPVPLPATTSQYLLTALRHIVRPSCDGWLSSK